MRVPTEKRYEEHIERELNSLLDDGLQFKSKVHQRDDGWYDKNLCVVGDEFIEFLKTTQEETYNKIHKKHGESTNQRILRRLNDEINNLKAGLNKSKDLIKTGGRIVCISFHSLEDRSVKQSFAPKRISYPKEIPLNNEVIKEFKVVAKKIKPSASELQRNKRSRSAIMRVFEKI